MQLAMLEKSAPSSERSESSFMATAGNGGTFASFGGIFRARLETSAIARHIGRCRGGFEMNWTPIDGVN